VAWRGRHAYRQRRGTGILCLPVFRCEAEGLSPFSPCRCLSRHASLHVPPELMSRIRVFGFGVRGVDVNEQVKWHFVFAFSRCKAECHLSTGRRPRLARHASLQMVLRLYVLPLRFLLLDGVRVYVCATGVSMSGVRGMGSNEQTEVAFCFRLF